MSDPRSQIVWGVFESGEPLAIDDTRDHGRLAEATPVRSAVVHPLGEYGVFIASATEPAAFDTTDKTLLEILSTALTAALERVDRETRLREREQRVQTERDRLNALFEMVPDPITHVRFENDDPILVGANTAFEDTFGERIDDVIGASSNDLIVPPARQDEAETIDEQVRTDGTISQEVRRQTSDGTGDFLFRSVPISSSDETEEYFGIYIDITDQKATERRLERQNERLDAFASVISHDLRNPLNVANLRLELAADECDSPHLESIAEAHDRMNALIDDLLTLAREGNQVSDVEAVALADLVQNCWRNVETADATIDLRVDQSIQANRSRLAQLFENLIRNAVDHAGRNATVVVGPVGDQDGLYVEDDGPGIPEDERDEVFEAGYSTAEGGTGFGLSIVDEVATAHGWDIRVTTGTEGGARFEITNVEFTD
jgi:PAS domain S-box-containing protein